MLQEKHRMKNCFIPTHSRSPCCVPPTLPTRKRSNVMETAKQITVTENESIQMNASPTSHHSDTIRYRSIKSEESFPSSSFSLEHASRQRESDSKAIVITRANSSDLIPSLPMRSVSPVQNGQYKNCNMWGNLNRAPCILDAEHQRKKDPESSQILKPQRKSNIFFDQNLNLILRHTETRSNEIPLMRPSIVVSSIACQMYPKKASILNAAQLGASEMNDSDFLSSRWSSSSSLSSIRHHKSLSLSMEFFLEEMSTRQRKLRNSKKHGSTSCLRVPKERGLNRSNSSLHLEDIMFGR